MGSCRSIRWGRAEDRRYFYKELADAGSAGSAGNAEESTDIAEEKRRKNVEGAKKSLSVR